MVSWCDLQLEDAACDGQPTVYRLLITGDSGLDTDGIQQGSRANVNF